MLIPFELFSLSLLVATSTALPSSPLPYYRGSAGKWNTHPAPQDRLRHQTSNVHLRLGTHSKYQCFNGNDHLSTDRWLDFDALWRLNSPTILSKNGGDTYIVHYIQEAIVEAAVESTIDARLILAVMMQESAGRATMPCKSCSNGTSKCGLMQASDGSSFDPSNVQASILQMVRDGVEGDDLDQALDGEARYLNDVANRLLGWDGRGDGYKACAS